MKNGFLNIFNFNKKFIYIVLLFLSAIFFFRGRLGSDDSEVFNLALAIKNSPLSFFDFIYFLKENYVSSFFNSEIFLENSQLPSFKTWNQRFMWVFQTYFIIYLVNFLPIKIETVNFLSMYFSGLVISFYACLSFYLSYFFFKKKFLNYEAFFLTIIIYFGTGLIAFFSGAFIESLIILLLVLRFNVQNNNKINYFLIDLVILLIKPYYFLILIPLHLNNFSKKKFFSKSLNLLILFFLIFSLRQLPLFKVPLSHYTKYEYANFSLDSFKILNNLFDQYFSFGVGIFITSFIPIILIIFGFKKNDTIYKIIFFFIFTVFLSFFEGNHGQAPGGRYILPAFFIFLEEFLIGFKKIKEKHSFILIFLFFFTILNLPTLEYRNFSLPHYKTNSVMSGKAAKMENKEGFVVKGTLFDYPIRSLSFNHTIFSNKILFLKILKSPAVKIENMVIDTEAIYPMTAPARILYLLDNKNSVFAKQVPIFFFKQKKIIYLFYYSSIIFFLFIFSKSFIKSYKRKKNDSL
jgi:hypothetical protein